MKVIATVIIIIEVIGIILAAMRIKETIIQLSKKARTVIAKKSTTKQRR